MSTPSRSRRDFIGQTSAAAAMAMLPFSSSRAAAAESASPAPWQIGCHGRPFRKWRLSLDGLLDAIQSAGYGSAEIVVSESAQAGRKATPENIAALGRALEARGMKTTIDYLDLPKGGSYRDAVASVRRQVATAQRLGQRYLLCLGVEKESDWLQACRVLADAAAYGQDRGVQIVLKQHHGLNNTALELLGWMEQVNHPNFRLFFDPGNLVYYTAKDPVAQLDLIAPHVVGLIAKDCTGAQYMERRSGDPGFGSQPPNPHGDEVMIQFGTGVVDLPAIFRKLKAAGFNGPVMVEGVAIGVSPQETIANARANREYVERVIAGLAS